MEAELLLRRHFPGLALCSSVALLAFGAEHLETILIGHAWLEPLVLAILIGTVTRTLWKPPASFDPGIHLSTKTLLEAAVALMGASMSFGAMRSVGWELLAGVAVTVLMTIGASFLFGRVLGLSMRMALLVACGNAICGNSAIAAVGPVIDAEGDDVATAIAFTAVLGIAVVLLLPAIASALHLDPAASGILAGLTVYAVPQVLAAAAPMGPLAVQLGTLVKLVRVLMLGPLLAGLSLLEIGRRQDRTRAGRLEISHVLPAFILIFLVLAIARSFELLPDVLVTHAHRASTVLTIVAMAGLGLGVDLRHISAAGPRISLTVTVSLLLLGSIAVGVIRLVGLA